MSTSNFDALRLLQVETALSRWREADLPSRPPHGWAATIRTALGMSATALARRLKMTASGLRKLEKAEADKTITLASLQKMADALNCELRYALVPRQPLEQMLLDRAREVISEEMKPVEHTMALEDQTVQGANRQRQIDALAKMLLAQKSRRALW
ncbi:mobile mystery protein A [Polaromonas sp. YR568]|uniref:mobile mystery protein A n=1 Tax=Polaromonas sp. YR568 TaxID=1855301 RepID=UPI00398BD308